MYIFHEFSACIEFSVGARNAPFWCIVRPKFFVHDLFTTEIKKRGKKKGVKRKGQLAYSHALFVLFWKLRFEDSWEICKGILVIIIREKAFCFVRNFKFVCNDLFLIRVTNFIFVVSYLYERIVNQFCLTKTAKCKIYKFS